MPDRRDRPNTIPWPPILFAGAALVALGLQVILPLPWPGGAVAASLAVAGLFLMAAGIALDLATALAFRRHRTTINPLHPEKTSRLVTGGIYRISRNPMYVGMALLLLAWAVYLQSPAALLGIGGFIAYITRFQIIPEESLLAQHFGADFETYRQRVRRWL